AGGRGVGGYIRYFSEAPMPVELAAIADPSERNVQRCLEQLDNQAAKPSIYTDWRVMLEREAPFDGVIIATPNYLHYAPAMDCLRHGVKAIALEKPLAPTPEDCAEIVAEAHAQGAGVQLGFVLRSTPFYKKVKELLEQGVVGRITTIQADELVELRTTSVNFRSPWRRYTDLGGGTMLEKCCHDMDMLTWLVGSRPLRVSSFGGRAIFQSNPTLPDRCGEHCPAHASCPYYIGRREMAEPLKAKLEPLCVYNSGADVMDHQSVQIVYANGTICNFVMNFHTSGERSSRNLHIIGTRGRIWGNMGANQLWSQDLSGAGETAHPIMTDGSGHGGGNRNHALAFLRLAAGGEVDSVATAYDAYLSAMLCFAADRSCRDVRQVSLRYPHTRHIEID
ncbi:MAG: Gfo/Idh/MocA family oxidoreductase, partial [Lentisphaerae bacterium]|nr:Gfo/Idh/MocA family oxidoreductase [Lentisphaerota bacterium]